MSENRSTIKIRHGSGIPTTSNLTARELGFSDTTQNLYIHNGNGITRIGINALTGSVDPVVADGQDGDFYIKTETTGNETKIVAVFSKVGGAWLEVSTGGGDASYLELTQAEYNALTPAEKNNGTIYFVTDATDEQGSNGHSYSSSEQIAGVWIDGSTVYEKTLTIQTSLASGATQVVDASFAGNRIIEWGGYNIAGNGTIYCLPDGRFRLLLSNQALSIASVNSGTWDGTSYITIRYTKQV